MTHKPLLIDLPVARYLQVVNLADQDIATRIAALIHNAISVSEPIDLINDPACIVHLMDKFEIERTFQPYDFIGWTYSQSYGKNVIHIAEDQQIEGRENFSFGKAVCLAVLLNSDPDFALPKRLSTPRGTTALPYADIFTQLDVTSIDGADASAEGLLECFIRQTPPCLHALRLEVMGADLDVDTLFDMLKKQTAAQHYRSLLEKSVVASDTADAFAAFLLHKTMPGTFNHPLVTSLTSQLVAGA